MKVPPSPKQHPGEFKTVKREAAFSVYFNSYALSPFILKVPTDETFYTLLKTNLKLHFCNFFVDLKQM